MLGFFRKHQKIFFLFITVVIVISFCFFGAYSSFAQQEVVVDRVVGMGIGGKPIKSKEMHSLCRLIDSSFFDIALREETPNLLNDGIIEKEFLSTGLGVLLVRPYFSDFKADLDERVKKIHAFCPYEHPQAPGVGLESFWHRFFPALIERYRALKMRSDQATLESFFLMTGLYLEQVRSLPLALTRQFLAMQSQQQGAPVDPRFDSTSLSLFGFKTMEEWFGPRFVPLVAHFIMNAAQIAEERGYSLTLDEVRKDLLKNAYIGYQQLVEGSDPQPEQVYQYYLLKIRSLGLDEMAVLGAWKKALLFRRLFEDASGCVLVDPLPYSQFGAFAQEGVTVTLYELAQPFQLVDFVSLLKFQLYLESIALEPALVRKSTEISCAVAPLEMIEKRAPELVDGSIEIRWKQVSKEEVMRTVSLKDMRSVEPSSLLLHALEIAPEHQEVLSFRSGGSLWKRLGLAAQPQFLDLCMKASLPEEPPNAASVALRSYAPDPDHLYHIQVIRRVGEKRILSYTEALKEGALDLLLDRTLERAYSDVRKKHSTLFQLESGEWKPFKMVKEEVGKIVFSNLLKAIERDYKAIWGSLPENKPMEFYSNARFLSAMVQEKEALMAHQEPSALLPLMGLSRLLVENTRVLSRSDPAPLSKEELFSLAVGSCSPVKIQERGQMAFCRLEGKAQREYSILQDVQQGHFILANDAKRDLMLQILARMNKQHVHFTPEAP